MSTTMNATHLQGLKDRTVEAYATYRSIRRSRGLEYSKEENAAYREFSTFYSMARAAGISGDELLAAMEEVEPPTFSLRG